MIEDLQSRYPGYDVLGKGKLSTPDWDAQTWRVVQERLNLDPLPRFFTIDEAETLGSVTERILPQPDRVSGEKVPIVPWIDAKLFHDRRDGYRYEDIPAQQTAWRLAIEGFDQTARELHGPRFAELEIELQEDVLATVERGNPPGAAWKSVSAERFFRNVLCVTVAKAYYSHPTAWNEIGYSGPASLRGHVRIWIGGVDPWEAHIRETTWETE